MEELTKEQLIEEAQKQIKDISWNIEYHRNKLDEYIQKMNLAQFALKELEK